MTLYHMKIIFTLDISDPRLNEITESIDGSHPVLQDAIECALEQTVPIVPTKEILQQYADAIRKGYESPKRHIEGIRFTRYDFIEPIVIEDKPSDKQGMTIERAKQLLFCTLQLIRQYRENQGKDPSDTDDLLFSELDMEVSEVEEIYAPYHVTVNTSSCYRDSESPKDFDKKYFDK